MNSHTGKGRLRRRLTCMSASKMPTAPPPVQIRLMETFRNLFYTPIYVAVSGGFFYRHGLNIVFTTMPDGGSVVNALRSGQADIAQTGVSRSLVELDMGHEDAPLHFAEINSRDGFFLVSREPVNGWQWNMLEGRRLAPVGFTPVPWNSLRAAMLSRIVDLSAVTLVRGLSAEDAMTRFRAGDIDYIHLPHPQAGLLVEEGAGHLATAIGPELGHVCYSSFAAMPGYIESNPDTVQKFVNGFDEALIWLQSANDSEVVSRVEPFFPMLQSTLLLDCIRQYRANRTWPSRAAITETSFNRMRDILIDGGMVRGHHEYSRLVRPEFAPGMMAG